jgi:hypothetical protein
LHGFVELGSLALAEAIVQKEHLMRVNVVGAKQPQDV